MSRTAEAVPDEACLQQLVCSLDHRSSHFASSAVISVIQRYLTTPFETDVSTVRARSREPLAANAQNTCIPVSVENRPRGRVAGQVALCEDQWLRGHEVFVVGPSFMGQQ